MTIAVSRSAPGDLAAGAKRTLRRADGVEGVEALDVRGITPGLNDLTVEADATLAVAPEAGERPDAVAAALADAFGVDDVTVEALRSVPPDRAEGAAASLGE